MHDLPLAVVLSSYCVYGVRGLAVRCRAYKMSRSCLMKLTDEARNQNCNLILQLSQLFCH